MISLLVIMRDKLSDCSSERRFTKQDQVVQARSLMDLTNRSAYAFRLGDRGGNFTQLTPTLSECFEIPR